MNRKGRLHLENQYMKLAIDLAKQTVGQTSPNPVVGAVIVKNHEIIGMGAHLKAGEPHAERHALEMAKRNAVGATMYVTLEPCSHHGRTPPCADAVIASGISKVVIASMDPNPKVAGNGIEKLRQAKIEVEVGVMKEEADQLNRVFFHYIRTGTPYVTLKTASSIDGKIATTSGESKWITGEAARLDVHELRYEHDAILVGVETVLKDDPLLTTRLNDGGKSPIRIVLDRQLRIPVQAKMLHDNEAKTWIMTTNRASLDKITQIENKNVKVFVLKNESLAIKELLQVIGKEQVTSLLVEGGGTVNDSFLRAGKFQRLVKYLAPVIIGGASAASSFSGEGIQLLKDAPRLALLSIDKLGQDLKLIYEKKEE
ncbi:riboflavin biosynthesis protein RibD [Salipaludibacillus neizhouensis]|uniref:Riboflavin biosynthesis protein RibD n=1 Tax=Salipaludibacillus neizhouensis TaxID=885475 RepID=A0A3A9KDD9_9BACI|nr:bifunctional diaminohydroxyphosphoribosylaminopyrimidine deaminase/5-amino-6-(5-phosphoribosylamino)uracil reductase RibD [Salipaludibacillus neizhouensis]RKL67653.1 riboflavin biosynthesis protein RibD [Salipaludibacillus neizhouensis]